MAASPEDNSASKVGLPPLTPLQLVRVVAGGLGVFNLLIGVGLYMSKGPITLIIANRVLTPQIWGVIFSLTGLLTLYALIAKKNTFLRIMMLIGVFLKTSWLIALSIHITIGGSFFIDVLWGFLAFVQVVLYIYFFSENQQSV